MKCNLKIIYLCIKNLIKAYSLCQFFNPLFFLHPFYPHPPMVAPFSPFNKNMWRLHFSPFPSGSVVSEEPLGSLYFCQAGPLAFLQLLRPFSWLSPHLLGPWSRAWAALQWETITTPHCLWSSDHMEAQQLTTCFSRQADQGKRKRNRRRKKSLTLHSYSFCCACRIC